MKLETLATSAPPRSAYIHVPFCKHRCGYCNFTLVADRDDLIESYLMAIELELSKLNEQRDVDTLFLGGGTPSHLSEDQLAALFGTLQKWFRLSGNYEFSLEANPNDLNEGRCRVMSEFGVNRISLGVQSFNDNKLKVLERDHSQSQIEQAFQLARECAGNVSIDLIFSAPGETLEVWQQDVSQAIALQPNHISTYGLTFETGTSFGTRLQQGDLQQSSEDVEGQMYETAIDTLVDAGFEHYEVSNFAANGYRCRHNETYWSGGGYYAAGPGAARYINGKRETNHRSVTTYLKKVLAGDSPVAESESLTGLERAKEQFVFQMRMLQGVELKQFQLDHKVGVAELLGDVYQTLLQHKLIQTTPTHVSLTRTGLMVSDSIWSLILSDC